VDCYYQTLLDADGKVLLHLSTFGSQDRQSEPKSSQSIQIDETVAQELMVLLANSFPRLRGGVDHE
jgi:5-methylcytosine-specific restriction protein B